MTARPATGYERRIGRYTRELAEALLAVVDLARGSRVLDVGCGSGALTAVLAGRVGAKSVVAIDPSAEALERCRRRVPEVELHQGQVESLPFADGGFDAVLAQLVVGLLDDHERGVAEMARVTRPGGRVAACVWDFADGMTLLRSFWDAAREVDPQQAAERDQAKTHPYSSRDALTELWRTAGLGDVRSGELVVGADYRDFEDLWQPLTEPDGSPGRFYAALTEDQSVRLRDELWRHLDRPEGPFRLSARAWYVVGTRR